MAYLILVLSLLLFARAAVGLAANVQPSAVQPPFAQTPVVQPAAVQPLAAPSPIQLLKSPVFEQIESNWSRPEGRAGPEFLKCDGKAFPTKKTMLAPFVMIGNDHGMYFIYSEFYVRLRPPILRRSFDDDAEERSYHDFLLFHNAPVRTENKQCNVSGKSGKFS